MASLRPLHTIVFDLDDTLYSERDYVLSGFSAVDVWLQETKQVGGFAALATERFQAGQRGRIFDECLSDLGLGAGPEIVRQMLAVYREHKPMLKLFPDAVQTLLHVYKCAMNLALITDGYAAVQLHKIHALGLESIIKYRIITDEMGRSHWKPSPEPFRRVMTHFGGDPSGFAYVGDNPHKDFIGCRPLGWQSVRVRRPGSEYAAYTASLEEAADVEIIELKELMELLRRD
jgi:putative hydrolase of the HAD superfamily